LAESDVEMDKKYLLNVDKALKLEKITYEKT